MLFEEKGDLFKHVHEAYGHGVNTLGRMTSGIAVNFRERYPQMYKEYRKKCLKKDLALGQVFFYDNSNLNLPSIFNLATQEDLRFANYDALLESFERMFYLARQKGITDIGIPMIGTGHGNLEKQSLIEASLPFIQSGKTHLTIYDY